MKKEKIETPRSCAICDKALSEKEIKFLNETSPASSYIDTCVEHGKLRSHFKPYAIPGSSLEIIKHLRVEYGKENSI